MSSSQVWMDQGGTFTDVVTVRQGVARAQKILSDRVSPSEWGRGGARLRRGTTVATNALLERRGEPVLLLTTQGFGDAPWIGDQVRPDLFALKIQRPLPLCDAVIEVAGRIAVGWAEGVEMGEAGSCQGAGPCVIEPPSVSVAELAEHRAAGVLAVAIVLVHGPLVPQAELELAETCRAAGFSQISLGHQVAPSRGFLARLHTTLADAALSPLLPRAPGDYMKSDGGLARVDDDGQSTEWRGSVAVLSGPAGGVIACQCLAAAHGLGPVFGLDMGGTSTDVCHIGDQVERVDHVDIGGLSLRVPAVAIHTVAAGGGSVLSAQGGAYRSGPRSAGADPGPACYGRGGPATVTDCQALLGLLPAFPAVAGPGRDQPLDLAAARQALASLAPGQAPELTAEGFGCVAVEAMARAVRVLAAARGVDPASRRLLAFGGAGPGHACAIARSLGVREVVVPFLAGVFSAVGIGLARRRIERVAPLIGSVAQAMERALAALPEQVEDGSARWALEWWLRLRVVGTSELLDVSVTDLLEAAASRARSSLLDAQAPALPDVLLRRFEAVHRERFGFSRPDQAVEALELRLVAQEDPTGAGCDFPRSSSATILPRGRTRAFFGSWREVPLRDLRDGAGLVGPALMVGGGTTVVLPPGWRVTAGPDHLLLADLGPPPLAMSTAAHPVYTAIFGTRLMAIAEQMGQRLAVLARSVSIRQRHDFSCALFDAQGHLVANAPHVPVHLGAMGHTVRDLIAVRGDAVVAGSAWASNNPYAGGSHLPDITVTMPVVAADGRRLGFVACRGHHVDVGGTSAGSMPAVARSIQEEGFLLRHVQILASERFIPPPVLELSLADGGCRQPQVLRADLEAQLAACALGVRGLQSLVEEVGHGAALAQLGHLQDQSEAAIIELLIALGDRQLGDRQLHGVWRQAVWLDAGPAPQHPLTVSLAVQAGRACLTLDSERHPLNLNAPPAVASAALLYVFRCLVAARGGEAAELPLSDGALRPFMIERTPGGLFDPQSPAAVAGGNVETSQRLVDALLLGLGALAESQGTMNNLTVGTPVGAFYETIGGGSGAGSGFAGAHGVQVHMTNTRATDVEELESAFPVRLLRHQRRRGSGGRGRWPGGDGVIKEWLFLAPADVSLLAGRRQRPAQGRAGGGAGQVGQDRCDQGQGWVPAPPSWRAQAGDRLCIETPGGGGWGVPQCDGEGECDPSG